MDDAMIDLMADDGMLRGRLDAYAEARLTPELAAATRMRARVLAVAHRRSALGLADPGLALLPTPDVEPRHTVSVRTVAVPSRRRGARRRALVVLVAATLTLGTAAGTALAARPGGALYAARLWAETLTLPAGAEARAVAELQRLRDRLSEADAAATAGDANGATAALRAYEAIVAEATAHAVAAGNSVAGAALEVGVAQQVTVLRHLANSLPDTAVPAIEAALQHAIDQSQDAIDRIGASPAGGSGGAGGAGDPTEKPTEKPTAQPTAAPIEKPTKEPKPTSEPTPVPAATERPGGRPTPEPGATPRPTPHGPGG